MLLERGPTKYGTACSAPTGASAREEAGARSDEEAANARGRAAAGASAARRAQCRRRRDLAGVARDLQGMVLAGRVPEMDDRARRAVEMRQLLRIQVQPVIS
eukprot:726323-Pyramimonas_sp.AAC.1